jgi:hypothetical protein
MMIVLNAWLGIYQRVHSRTREETQARAVLSLYLAIPLAYVVFSLLSVAEVDRGFMLLSGLAALFATLLHRVHSAHSRTGCLLSHRVLVFGAVRRRKTSAAFCASRIRISRSLASIPVRTDTEIVVPSQVILSQDHVALRHGACAEGRRDHRCRARAPRWRTSPCANSWTASCPASRCSTWRAISNVPSGRFVSIRCASAG